jgi:hypothetical protein
VEHAVHHGLGEVCRVLRADHHVPKLARPRAHALLVDREGEHVGRPVEAAMLAVQAADLVLAHERDSQVPVRHPGGPQRRLCGRAQLLRSVYEVQLDQACPWRRASRSGGACFSEYSL